jgi:hypothetical protein
MLVHSGAYGLHGRACADLGRRDAVGAVERVLDQPGRGDGQARCPVRSCSVLRQVPLLVSLLENGAHFVSHYGARMKLHRLALVMLFLFVAGVVSTAAGQALNAFASADQVSAGSSSSSCPDPDGDGSPCGPACPCACCGHSVGPRSCRYCLSSRPRCLTSLHRRCPTIFTRTTFAYAFSTRLAPDAFRLRRRRCARL